MSERDIDRYELDTRGPWSFAESVRFLEGFEPAALTPSGQAVLRLALIPDGAAEAAGVLIRPLDGADDRVEVLVSGGARERAVEQVRRVLSIDRDGSGIANVAARDAVIGPLWRARGYLRPVLFHSPYEAAAWAIIGNRIRIRQAARIKAGMARDMGAAVTLPDGVTVHAFPAPQALATLEGYPGLSDRKVAWLRGIGEAALRGDLLTDRLREMPVEAALDHLQSLDGIGPFGAELILLRGAGEVDLAPRHEQRFARAVAMVYDLDSTPTSAELEAISDGWRPYRTWVAVLLRRVLEDRTHEIAA